MSLKIYKFCISYDESKINIITDYSDFDEQIKKQLPALSVKKFQPGISDTVEFYTKEISSAGLYYNKTIAMTFDQFSNETVEFAIDKILMILSAISLPERMFLHAGGVFWKNTGILIPGVSYSGKTTLVKEFVKNGADCFSDDCVVLDREGFMLPFPKKLAVRTANGRILQTAGYLGGRNAESKKKVNLIIFAVYGENNIWNPRKVSAGESSLKLLDNFYYRPSVGDAPAEILKNLALLTTQTKSFSGERGEADQLLDWILSALIS